MPFRTAGLGKHASTHADGGSDEITSVLDLGALRVIGGTAEFVDDWGDNLLTNRENSGSGLVSGPGLAVRRCKNYRPEWTTESGSPSATDERLYLPQSATAQAISVPSTFTEGAWESDFRFTNTTATQWLADYIMRISGEDTGYLLNHANDGSAYRIQKRITGTLTNLIDVTWAEDTDWHVQKGTRDADGNFELFLDRVSKGTATDTDITSSDKLWLENGSQDVSASYRDNLRVY